MLEIEILRVTVVSDDKCDRSKERSAGSAAAQARSSSAGSDKP